MKEINERLILITGKACIEKDLGDLGDDVTIVVRGNILKIEEEDDHEGGKNRVYKVKQITAEKYGEGAKQ